MSNVPASGISLSSETEGRELDSEPNTKNEEETKMFRANKLRVHILRKFESNWKS